LETIEQRTPNLAVFICHRSMDGFDAAQWLYEKLHGQQIGNSRADVFLDRFSPAVADWRNVHQKTLEISVALIFVATPGAFVKLESNDWVHFELEWWVKHRNSAPIVLDTIGDGDRWIPEVVRNKWPSLKTISFLPTTWPPDEISAREERIIGLVIDGIRSSQTLFTSDIGARKSNLLSRILKTFGFGSIQTQLDHRSKELAKTQNELDEITSRISKLTDEKRKLEKQFASLQSELHEHRPKVFLSYAREDETAVRNLYRALKKRECSLGSIKKIYWLESNGIERFARRFANPILLSFVYPLAWGASEGIFSENYDWRSKHTKNCPRVKLFSFPFDLRSVRCQRIFASTSTRICLTMTGLSGS
jgi:hypothetical protein